MDSIFKICKKGNCGISIIGLEKDNNEYINEDNELYSIRSYKYSESITINVVSSITSDGEYTIQAEELVTHVSTGIDQADVEFPIDGLYEVTHIILPNQLYISKWSDSFTTAHYSDLYYYDEEDNQYKLYNIKTKESIVVTLDNILEVNSLSENKEGGKTSIIRSDQNTFCMCYINECFYRLCKDILSKFCGKCINKLGYTKEDVYNRDIIWMSINIIKYLIGFGQYYEAQRILESITQCGNICREQNPKKGGGCGCHS